MRSIRRLLHVTAPLMREHVQSSLANTLGLLSLPGEGGSRLPGEDYNGFGFLTAGVEQALQGACIRDEVKDKLKEIGMTLSEGQQQRLCIARAIAAEPKAPLMDDPPSSRATCSRHPTLPTSASTSSTWKPPEPSGAGSDLPPTRTFDLSREGKNDSLTGHPFSLPS